MSFKFTIKIDGEEDSREIEVVSRDILRWEKSNPRNKMADLREGMSMTTMYDLAWRATVRMGVFEGKLVDFHETVDIAVDGGSEEEEGEESEENPTK